MADNTVKIIWSYRPDDPNQQGKTEAVDVDEARIKVREGLAIYADDKAARDKYEKQAAAEAKKAENNSETQTTVVAPTTAAAK